MKQFWNKDNWDYDKYVKAQIALNKKKISNTWVKESEIKFISQFIKEAKYGICHGARNGFEVRMFKKYTDANVIGTDISDNAKKYGLIQWDYHLVKSEWINKFDSEWVKKFDFVYTNSLDHSHYPELAISVFMNQLKRNGKCIIHDNGEKDCSINKADCFTASHDELMKIFNYYNDPIEFYKTNYKNRIIYILYNDRKVPIQI